MAKMLSNCYWLGPLILFLFGSCQVPEKQHHVLASTAPPKKRVVILTDMTHDDGNSLIRFLYYAPYFDLEGLIVTPQLPDYPYNATEPWEKAQRILSAYREIHPQLRKHHPDFPTYRELKRVTKQGRGALPIIWRTNEKYYKGSIAGREVESRWGEIRFDDWVGEGTNPHGEPKDSEGSRHLEQVFAASDYRPIFVECWGGPITLVQALYRYKQAHTRAEFQQLLNKLHVYSIHLQDITFDYFLDLDHLKEHSCINIGETSSTYDGSRVRPKWFLFDHGHFWKYIKVMDPANVQPYGAMAALYDHGGEGDSPSFLYLISAQLGLNDPLQPTHGSWGGRFEPMGEPFPSGYFSTCEVDTLALYRWIDQARNSFMARLEWSVLEPEQSNHPPRAVIDRDASLSVISVPAAAGDVLLFDAKNSTDPDGDKLSFRWYVLPAAGTYPRAVGLERSQQSALTFRVPPDLGQDEIHLILEVTDNGLPPLTAYRRVVIKGK